jgi:hypothetical protein
VAARAGRLRIAQNVAAPTSATKAYSAYEKMRLDASVMRLDHSRPGDGKLVDGNERAQHDGGHKCSTAHDPANQAIIRQASDLIDLHGLNGGSPCRPETRFQPLFPTAGAAGFRLIRQFSECVATEALSFVRDRLAYASRALLYAAHNAIQGVIDELTDVIGDAPSRFAVPDRRRSRFSRSLTSSSIAATSSAAMDFARVVILHLKELIFLIPRWTWCGPKCSKSRGRPMAGKHALHSRRECRATVEAPRR